MGGRHVQVVLLLPCNKQSEAALRGHGETKLLGFHFLVFYSAVVDTGKVLFTPSVWILLAGLSLVQSPSCPLRPPVGPLLLPGPPGLLPSPSPAFPALTFPIPAPDFSSQLCFDPDTPAHIYSSSGAILTFLSSVFPLRDLMEQPCGPCVFVVMKSLPWNPPNLVWYRSKSVPSAQWPSAFVRGVWNAGHGFFEYIPIFTNVLHKVLTMK